MTVVRAAVVQAAPAAFDTGRTLERFDARLSEARSHGASLAVFPEAYLGGYPKGADFGVRVGMRSDEGRVVFQRYFESAVEVPGATLSRVSEIVAAHAMHVVLGAIEREGGTLYCTALYFDASGVLLGKHRKLVPTAAERFLWGSGDGSTITVVDTELGKIGAAICWENRMPLLRNALYAMGTQLYCAPTVDDRESWIPTVRHIAIEGRCFVLSACQFARRADYPDDFATSFGNEPDAILIGGGSCIVDPFGKILAGPLRDGDGVLVADLDLDAIVRGKFDFDVTGHYARDDVFRFGIRDRD